MCPGVPRVKRTISARRSSGPGVRDRPVRVTRASEEASVRLGKALAVGVVESVHEDDTPTAERATDEATSGVVSAAAPIFDAVEEKPAATSAR